MALPKFQMGMTSMSHANKSSAPHARAGNGRDLTTIEKWETDDRHMAFPSTMYIWTNALNPSSNLWTRGDTQSN
jgi:hypothetical protein